MPKMIRKRVQNGWVVRDAIHGACSAPFFDYDEACKYAKAIYNPHTCRPIVVENYVYKTVLVADDEYDVFR